MGAQQSTAFASSAHSGLLRPGAATTAVPCSRASAGGVSFYPQLSQGACCRQSRKRSRAAFACRASSDDSNTNPIDRARSTNDDSASSELNNSQPEQTPDLSAQWQTFITGRARKATTTSCSAAHAPQTGGRQPRLDDVHTDFEDDDLMTTWDFVYATPSDLPLNHPEHPDNQYSSIHPPEGWNDRQRVLEYEPGDDACIWDQYRQVYVLLFGIGTADSEGIYSLRDLAHQGNSYQDTIIAFEELEDAHRYSSQLQHSMHHQPSVVPINPCELLTFCNEAGYRCKLEEAGTKLTPPSFNVGITDWERSLRQRNGDYFSQDYNDFESDAMMADFMVASSQHSREAYFLESCYNVESSMGAEIERTRAELENMWDTEEQ